MNDQLFSIADFDDITAAEDGKSPLNPKSLVVVSDAKQERSLATSEPGHRCQSERRGCSCVNEDSQLNHLIFNRTVTLKHDWAKLPKKQGGGHSWPSKNVKRKFAWASWRRKHLLLIVD